MQRRDFLSTAAATGFGFVGSAMAGEGQTSGQAGKLTPPKEGLISVAVAISEGTTDIDWVGPEAVFNSFYFDAAQKKYLPRFKLFTVSHTLQLKRHFIPDYTFDTAPEPKVVVIPAQRGSPELLAWLRQVHDAADVVMSVCSGARHLAKAGLLKGVKATTHFEDINTVTKQYPEVQWVRGVRFVEGPKISTGGGMTAGIDLALRVRERYFGRDEAQKVADHMEYQSKGWIVG